MSAKQRLARAKAFALKWFLPIGFAFAILIALAWPLPGKVVGGWQSGDYRIVQSINVVTVFLISGVSLRAAEAKQALSSSGWKAFIFSFVMIVGIFPLLGFGTVRIPFQIEEFKYGLAVWCAVPTTIAVGVALVSQAGGNAALALLITVVTNLLGVVIVPFWLQAYLHGQSININVAALLTNLIVTVLVPMVVGQILRYFFKPLRAWVAAHRIYLKLISNLSLICIVWQTISKSAKQILSVSGSAILTIIAASIIFHLLQLAISYPLASHLLKLPLSERKCAIIMSSQKTLPVAVAVIGSLTALGSEGLICIPPIIGQQAQLFIDAFIAGHWGSDDGTADENAAVLHHEERAEGSSEQPPAVAVV